MKAQYVRGNLRLLLHEYNLGRLKEGKSALSQGQFAAIVGVDRSTIVRWVSGDVMEYRKVDKGAADRVAQELGVTLERLFSPVNKQGYPVDASLSQHAPASQPA